MTRNKRTKEDRSQEVMKVCKECVVAQFCRTTRYSLVCHSITYNSIHLTLGIASISDI